MPRTPTGERAEGHMIDLLIRIAVNTVALLVATKVVPKLDLAFGPNGSEWWRAVGVAILFGVVNSYLKPILKILSLPLTLITMGLVGFVINLGLFLFVGFLSGELKLGLSIAGWPKGAISVDVIVTALIASVVMSIVATALSMFLSSRRILGM
jgi:putative membrane protein